MAPSRRPIPVTARAARGPLRILFSCIGRRVELVQAFRRAAGALRLNIETWGADQSPAAPALEFVDGHLRVPPVSDPVYVPALLRFVRMRGIHLVVPLIDLDLLTLAVHRPDFERLGCTVLVSDARTVATCRDKLLTYAHLVASGIDTPRTWTLPQIAARKRHAFPYFVKPRAGSASTGLHLVRDAADLAQAIRRVCDPIVQEYIAGPEYTLDTYTGLNGRPACVVARRRLRVRGGEVTQSQVVGHRDLLALGRRVVRSLPGCRGVITIQCIRRPDRGLAVVEINPRFGGGVPLSIAAGADMPRWLLQEYLGRTPRIPPTARRIGLMMSRYDSSVFRMCTVEQSPE